MARKPLPSAPSPTQTVTLKIGPTVWGVHWISAPDAQHWILGALEGSLPVYPLRTKIQCYWGSAEGQWEQTVLLEALHSTQWTVKLLGAARCNNFRKSPRVPVAAALRYGDPTNLWKGTTLDISRTGCHFQSGRPFVRGEACYCEFTLGGHMFTVQSQVVRARKLGEQRWDVGVQFHHLSPTLQSQLDAELKHAAAYHQALQQ